MAENEEKIFEYYLMLPTNVRSTINDEMEPDDRCRMIRCSKSCNQEANASRNYIYQLAFHKISDNIIRIDVEYGSHARSDDDVFGYVLFFGPDEFGKKFKHYCAERFQRFWVDELDNSTDMVELAIAEFKCLLQRYQKIIRKVNFHDPVTDNRAGLLDNVDFEIEGIDNLESLQVVGDYDIRKIFAKVRKPLKDLTVFGEKNSAILADCEEMYQVQQILVAWELKLNKQQYSRLSASNVRLHIGNWTERDVFKIIRSWQDGTIDKKTESLGWRLGDSNFEIRKLLRLLRIGDDLVGGTIEIKHFGDDGKCAFLSEFHKHLYFTTD